MHTVDVTLLMSLAYVDILIYAYRTACLHHWGGIREAQPDKDPEFISWVNLTGGFWGNS